MRLVTKTDVNVRSGPSMIFKVNSTIDAGKEIHSSEYKRDTEGIGWYKVNDGWVCAEYVSAAKDADANSVVNTNLKRHAIDTGIIVDQITNGSGIATTAASSVARDFFGVQTGEGPDNVLARKIFGAPYQFRETVDPRGEGRDAKLGMDYLYMMNEAPIISVMPGKAMFLPDCTESEKENFLKGFNEALDGFTKTGIHLKDGIDALLKPDDCEIRYFGFDNDYTNYKQYVNTLCWMFAVMLGISENTVPGMPLGKENTFGTFDWSRWRLSYAFANRAPNITLGLADSGAGISDAFGGASKSAENTENEGGDLVDKAKSVIAYLTDFTDNEPYYTDFFINPSVSYSETVSNQSSPSMIENVVRGASEMSKELSFLLNAGVTAGTGNESQENVAKMIKQAGGGITGGNGILNRLVSGVSSIISGANIIFPEIWKASVYQKSYNISITLKTPYGTKESIFTYILVPYAHWLCLAAPKQQSVNTYGAPFLVKAFIPGFCSVEMGLIESLTITKGGDGSAWSVDGLPLEMNLDISIKDLYSNLMISRINLVSPTDIYNFFWNQSFMDYARVQSGLNLKQSEAMIKWETLKAIEKNQLSPDAVSSKFQDIIKESISRFVHKQ